MAKRGLNYLKYRCPHCGEEVAIEKTSEEETIDDWMTEYGWEKIRRNRYVCPDCYYEGGR